MWSPLKKRQSPFGWCKCNAPEEYSLGQDDDCVGAKHPQRDCKLSLDHPILCKIYIQDSAQRCFKERHAHKSPITIAPSWHWKSSNFSFHFIWFLLWRFRVFFFPFFLFLSSSSHVWWVKLVTGSNFPPVRLRSATVVRRWWITHSRRDGKTALIKSLLLPLLLLKPVSSLPDTCCIYTCVCGCITFQAADPFV